MMKEGGSSNHSVMPNSLQSHDLQSTSLLCTWNSLDKKNWSGLPFPSPRDLPNPGIEPRSPALQQILYCLSHHGDRDKKVKQAHVYVPRQFQVCSIRQFNAQNLIKCQIQSCVCVCVCVLSHIHLLRPHGL